MQVTPHGQSLLLALQRAQKQMILKTTTYGDIRVTEQENGFLLEDSKGLRQVYHGQWNEDHLAKFRDYQQQHEQYKKYKDPIQPYPPNPKGFPEDFPWSEPAESVADLRNKIRELEVSLSIANEKLKNYVKVLQEAQTKEKEATESLDLARECAREAQRLAHHRGQQISELIEEKKELKRQLKGEEPRPGYPFEVILNHETKTRYARDSRNQRVTRIRETEWIAMHRHNPDDVLAAYTAIFDRIATGAK